MQSTVPLRRAVEWPGQVERRKHIKEFQGLEWMYYGCLNEPHRHSQRWSKVLRQQSLAQLEKTTKGLDFDLSI